MTIPANLAGILSTGNRDEPLTAEDYARLAQVNDDFDIAMAERLNELTPDQVCALFDLARVGLAVHELREHAGLATAIDFIESEQDGWLVVTPGEPEAENAYEAVTSLLKLLRSEP